MEKELSVHPQTGFLNSKYFIFTRPDTITFLTIRHLGAEASKHFERIKCKGAYCRHFSKPGKYKVEIEGTSINTVIEVKDA